MIDTIKLVIPFNQRPKWVEEARLQQSVDATKGIFKATANPSSSYKKAGVYQPRLTYTERPRGSNIKSYELAIELSLPKLIYGNNFSELTDQDFPIVIKRLSDVMRSTYNIWIFPYQLEKAKVQKIDFSKNIPFTDRTPVSSVISHMQMADISKTYDVQNTNFRNGGHVYHIHTNSLDVAMYDKVADLKQEKISPKRSQEKDGYTQMKLLEELEKQKALTIARFEVRLNGVRKIKSELTSTGIKTDLSFKEMFSSEISKKILLRHWGNIFAKIPKSALDTDTPESQLVNIAKSNPRLTLTQALASAHYQSLLKGNSERYIRNIAEQLYSPSQYRRFKQKSREPPPSQLKSLVQITNTITEMKPTMIENYASIC